MPTRKNAIILLHEKLMTRITLAARYILFFLIS